MESRPMFSLVNSPAFTMHEMMCCPFWVLCGWRLGLENRGDFSVIIGLERNLL